MLKLQADIRWPPATLSGALLPTILLAPYSTRSQAGAIGAVRDGSAGAAECQAYDAFEEVDYLAVGAAGAEEGKEDHSGERRVLLEESARHLEALANAQ